jgi:hypothetical protein
VTTPGSGPRPKCLCFCKVAHPNTTEVCDPTRPVFSVRTNSITLGEIKIPVCTGCFNAREIHVGPDHSAPVLRAEAEEGEGGSCRSPGLLPGWLPDSPRCERVAAPEQHDRGLYVPGSLLSARLWLYLSLLLGPGPR